jgi:hypothetical protein
VGVECLTEPDRSRILVGETPVDVLGSILWFTIGGTSDQQQPTRVNRNQLGTWFEELDLPVEHLPPTARRVDAFRAASSSIIHTHRLGTEEAVRTVTLSVREVTYNEHLVIRHLIREETESHGRAHSMETVAELKFFRAARSSRGRRPGTEDITKTIPPRVRGEAREQVDAWMEAFDTAYNAAGEWLSAAALRKVVRDTITGLQAIPVKPSGGVYFLHSEKQGYVDALEQLILRFGRHSHFHQIPLVSCEKQVAMLAEAFTEDIERQVEKMMTSIEDATARTGRLSAARYKDFYGDYLVLQDACAHHAAKLGVSLKDSCRPLQRVQAALDQTPGGAPIEDGAREG